MKNNNPFLTSKRIADNENTQKKGIKNPFIEAKKNADDNKNKKKRKSILFYLDDYKKIVALSKTKGETITGYINSIVDKEVSKLNEYDKERFDKFLK